MLYIKAGDFVALAELNDVIARLAGFHLAINTYIGSISFIMKGSGMEDRWKTISYSNVIEHMITGNAYFEQYVYIFSTTALVLRVSIEPLNRRKSE